MGKNNVLETKYLSQPRGDGTSWMLRLETPRDLIGRENEKTSGIYRKNIHEGLGTNDIKLARKRRDIRLGEIRAEEAKVQAEKAGDTELALKNADALRRVRHPVAKEIIKEGIEKYANEKLVPTSGVAKAQQWHDIAVGQNMPVSVIYEKYLEDQGKHLSLSTRNNLATAWKHFLAFFPDNIAIQDVDRLWVSKFATEYLPSCRTPKAPNGPGPATIRKTLSMLKQLWKWGMKRGYLAMEPITPWDQQGPDKKQIKRSAKKRRPFSPDETVKLLEAEPAGSPLGDVMRIALSTGARLEEIAGIDTNDVDRDGNGYWIKDGKTDNAQRYIPLTGVAREIFARRLGGKDDEDVGPLFRELRIRASTGKRGSVLSQKFSRLRRKILGVETDGELAEHSFRHTWRTAARRAGVDELTIKELGGWDKGDGAEHIYDHGLEKERYQEAQRKIASWLVDQGYFGDEKLHGPSP